MRVAWEQHSDTWFARVGQCMLTLREMPWYDARARANRDAIDRMWVYSVRSYADVSTPQTIAEGTFEVSRERYRGGLEEAQEHTVELARSAGCKRERRVREAPDPASVAWLENRLLETLRDSYRNWRDSVARFGPRTYPEPRWSTALLAMEAAQYNRPDDLDVADRRFYQMVRATLERLRRRGLVSGSQGLDLNGRTTTLWEPV